MPIKNKKYIKNLLTNILIFLSAIIIKKHRPTIIAITGNVGKTSAKDAIYTICKKAGLYVHKTPKSFNSEIGVPLTVFLINKSPWNNPLEWIKIFLKAFVLFFKKDYPRYLIIEAGVDKPNDMDKIKKALGNKIDIAVFTALPKIATHVSNFNSYLDIVKEKLKLADIATNIVANKKDELLRKFLKDNKGIFWYNTDANYIKESKIKYGKNNFPEGEIVYIQTGDKICKIFLKNILGDYLAEGYLAGLIILDLLGVTIDCSKDIVAAFSAGRMRILHGINKSIIIDDSYNATYLATKKAIQTINKIIANRKFFVFGGMLELGEKEMEAHQKIGEYAKNVFDYIFVVDGPAKYTALSAKEKSKIFKNKTELINHLKNNIKNSDLIYIKASQGFRFEKISESLLQDKKDVKYLPRQELQWKNR